MNGATTIQERLKDLRLNKGLKLEELAEQTGISKSALGSYEKDDYKEINHGNLILLADFYGVSLDYLFCRTENRAEINTPLRELHLSDEMVALLKSGRINNRLLCELATHKDFPRLMADITIMVDRIADMRIQQLNEVMESTRQEIIRQFSPDENDLYLRTLEVAQVEENDYFSHVVHEDIDRIVRDIREAHKKDKTTADEQPDAYMNRINQKYLPIIQSGISGEEAFIQVFCDQIGVPYESLTSEEFTTFMRILSRSKTNKTPQNMRGKGSPIPPTWNGRKRRK